MMFFALFMIIVLLVSVSIIYNTATYNSYISDGIKHWRFKKAIKTSIYDAFENYPEEIEKRKEESGFIREDERYKFSTGIKRHLIPVNYSIYYKLISDVDEFFKSTPLEFDMAVTFFTKNNIKVLDEDPCDIFDIVQFFVLYENIDEEYSRILRKLVSTNVNLLFATLIETANTLYFVSDNNISKMAEISRKIMSTINNKTVFEFKELKETILEERKKLLVKEKNRVQQEQDKNNVIFIVFNKVSKYLSQIDYKYYKVLEKLYDKIVSNKNVFRTIVSFIFFILFVAADGLRIIFIVLPLRIINSIVNSFLDKENLKYCSSDSPANMIFNITIYPYMKQYT